MKINDFTNFSANAYLSEYYSSLNPENKFLLSFYHEFYSQVPHLLDLIELGGGPTIYQLISAVNMVDNIVFSDYAESNIAEINAFLGHNLNCWNWDEYIAYTLKLEGLVPNPALIDERKAKIRSKIGKVIKCDIREEKPLLGYSKTQFDVLSMGSVADSIASTEKQLVSYLENAFSLIKTGGYFVGFFAKNFKSWTHLDQIYKIYPIDEIFIKKIFAHFGLNVIQITNSVPPDYNQEYGGIFAVSAIKNK